MFFEKLLSNLAAMFFISAMPFFYLHYVEHVPMVHYLGYVLAGIGAFFYPR